MTYNLSCWNELFLVLHYPVEGFDKLSDMSDKYTLFIVQPARVCVSTFIFVTLWKLSIHSTSSVVCVFTNTHSRLGRLLLKALRHSVPHCRCFRTHQNRSMPLFCSYF